MVGRPWTMATLCLVLVGGVFPVFAQEPAEPEIGEVVVTATRTPELAGAGTKSVTVITAEEIAIKQVQSVGEALRSVPGATIVQTGTLGGQTSTFLRGSNSNQTLFLIDGIPVNTPTDGAFDLADLSIENVERIEVVRGPQSTLYGSSAMGGVINVITRKGAGPPTHTLSLAAGMHSTFKEVVKSAGGTERADYAITTLRLDSQGQGQHDEYANTTVSARVGVKPTPTTRLEIFSLFIDADKDLPPVLGRQDNSTGAAFDPDQNQRREFLQVGTAWSQALTPWWDYKLILARVGDRLKFTDPPLSTDVTDTTTYDVEGVTSFRPFPATVLTLGGQWKQDNADVTGTFTAFDATTTLRAGYVQGQVTLWESLTLVAGGRLDDYSQFGDHSTGQVSAAYVLRSTGTTLRAGYGTAFRAPSMNQVFRPGSGNPNLRPEQSRSFEAGAEQAIWDNHLRLGATYFYTRFTDLIDFGPGPSFQSMNIDRARAEGVEVFAETRPVPELLFRGGYTFTEAVDSDTGQPLRRRPKHLGSAAATYEFNKRYSVSLSGLFVGKRFDTDPVTFGLAENGGYAKFDLAAAATLSERWGPLSGVRLTAKVQNLLDKQYEEVLGFPSLGLTYLVGVEATF